MFFLTPDNYRAAPSDANLGLGTDPLTRNTYSYVNGDPVNLADPSGHCWFCGVADALSASLSIARPRSSQHHGGGLWDQALGVAGDVGGFVSDLGTDAGSSVLGVADTVGGSFFGFSKGVVETGVGAGQGLYQIAKLEGTTAKSWVTDPSGSLGNLKRGWGQLTAGLGVVSAHPTSLPKVLLAPALNDFAHGRYAEGVGRIGAMILGPKVVGEGVGALGGAIEGDSGAANAANGLRLNQQLTADEVSGGHAFDKHVIEGDQFPGVSTREQFAQRIESVMRDASEMKTLSNGRTAYWESSSDTVVIRDPSAADGGTAFVPRDGKAYFDGLR